MVGDLWSRPPRRFFVSVFGVLLSILPISAGWRVVVSCTLPPANPLSRDLCQLVLLAVVVLVLQLAQDRPLDKVLDRLVFGRDGDA